MIILDTNVISELVAPSPSPVVVRWVRGVTQQVGLTVINRAEIMMGLLSMPAGARRDAILHATLQELSGLECLSLSAAGVDRFARMWADKRAQGRVLGEFDGLIAAICLERGATLATRNVSEFTGLGLDLINPWDVG